MVTTPSRTKGRTMVHLPNSIATGPSPYRTHFLGFIQDVNIESDTPQRRFAAMDDNSNREGNLVDMTIASLVQRYGPKPHEVIGGNTSALSRLARHSVTIRRNMRDGTAAEMHTRLSGDDLHHMYI